MQSRSRPQSTSNRAGCPAPSSQSLASRHGKYRRCCRKRLWRSWRRHPWLRALHPWPGRTGSALYLSPRERGLLPGSLRRRRYRPRCPRSYRRNPAPSRQFDPCPWRTLPMIKSPRANRIGQFTFSRARKPACNVAWPTALAVPHSLLDCADEVIAYQEAAPAWGRSTEAVGVLRETTGGCGFRSSRPHPTAARSLLLTLLIWGARPAPDGGYWPVSD